VMAMAAITLVSLYFLPETNQRDINDADAAADRPGAEANLSAARTDRPDEDALQ